MLCILSSPCNLNCLFEILLLFEYTSTLCWIQELRMEKTKKMYLFKTSEYSIKTTKRGRVAASLTILHFHLQYDCVSSPNAQKKAKMQLNVRHKISVLIKTLN